MRPEHKLLEKVLQNKYVKIAVWVLIALAILNYLLNLVSF